MDRKWVNMAYYIPLSIPLIYFGVLFVYASIYYQSYYGTLTQVPFDFYSLLVGLFLTIASLGAIYVMAYRERQTLQEHKGKIVSLQTRLEESKARLLEAENAKQELAQRYNKLQSDFRGCESRLIQQKQKHQSLIVEFLVTQELGKIFNSDLFDDLQKKGRIEEPNKSGEEAAERKVKTLSGGYSGAKIYSFYRERSNVPDVLKMAEKEEIENEHEKFTTHVRTPTKRTILPIGPNEGQAYLWENYGGLEYNFVQDALDNGYLTFMELYQAGLYGSSQTQVQVSAIQQVIHRLFDNMNRAWGWTNLDLRNLNIYEQYFPFTRKFTKIRHHLLKTQQWLSKSSLTTPIWKEALEELDNFLDEIEWDQRANDPLYNSPIAMGVIHGDLNSRNILLGINPDDYSVRTIRLVDFSHTGNGLTRKQTEYFVREKKIRLFCDRHGIYLGHIANDFCRLETDIKFYLTELNDERDLEMAWVLECLLLKYGLSLPNWDELNWEELKADSKFKEILSLQGLSKAANEANRWNSIIGSSSWTGNEARKFSWAWQSIKAIRDSFRNILPRGVVSMQPYYLALLQASLSMIYYEDERFRDANLQKLYLALASALLCNRLLQPPRFSL